LLDHRREHEGVERPELATGLAAAQDLLEVAHDRAVWVSLSGCRAARFVVDGGRDRPDGPHPGTVGIDVGDDAGDVGAQLGGRRLGSRQGRPDDRPGGRVDVCPGEEELVDGAVDVDDDRPHQVGLVLEVV
jgi:hypothetical protein